MPGPVPKRSEERVRRNKLETPIETVPMIGEVPVPDLGIPDAHPIVIDLYNSLAESGQAKYYEPSDWQAARLLCFVLNDFLSRERLSGQMLTAIQSLMSDLMITEGSRRRLRMEIDRAQAESSADDGTAEIIELYKEMMNTK